MSLHIDLSLPESLFPLEDRFLDCVDLCVGSFNITHVFTRNLRRMAEEIGVYNACWRPDELGITEAQDMVDILDEGIRLLESNPYEYVQYESDNGWGRVSTLLSFLKKYRHVAYKYPEAIITIRR